MFRRYISALLAVAMLLCCIQPAYGYSETTTWYEYTPGDIVYDLKTDKIVYTNGVTINDENGITFSENGKVTYEFHLPFDALRLVFKTERRAATDRNNRKINLTVNSKKQTLYVSQYNGTVIWDIDPCLYSGDVTMTFECDLPLKVKQIHIEKMPLQSVDLGSPSTRSQGIQYTEYEKAMQTAVVIKENCPVIKVNGAIRYVDYNDWTITPLEENNTLYLPISSFARAFGCYYEEEYGYALLRSDSLEFVLDNEKLYRQSNGGEYSEIANNFLIKNNRVYVPVRSYAQALGENVYYKDGYVIADYKERAENILNTEVFGFLKDEFAQYSATAVTGTTYFVAKTKNASDSNPGTEDAPFATIEKASSVAKAGDTVMIGEGEYRETLKPVNDGTAASPIVYRAREGENVIISTLEDLGRPDYEEDGLFVYDVSDYNIRRGGNMVFYKGEAVNQARHPNTGTSPRMYPGDYIELSKYWPTQGDIQPNITGKYNPLNNATSSNDLEQPDNYWAGGMLVAFAYSGYYRQWYEIDGSTQGKLFLGNHSPFGFFYDASFKEDTDNAFITLTKNAIDIPGEWHWDKEKLYIMPFEGETADTFSIQGKKRLNTVDLAGRKCIQIIGINTLGGGMRLKDSELCVINGGTHEHVSHITYLYDNNEEVDRRDSGHDTVHEDTVVTLGEAGICLGGKNNAVINTTVRYSALSGIYAQGKYQYIENNYVTETGNAGYYQSGIVLKISGLESVSGEAFGGHSVFNNTVEKSGRSCLTINNTCYPMAYESGVISHIPSEVAYNDFSDGMLFSRDGGLVYSYSCFHGNDMIKTKIHDNLVWNNWSDRNETTSTSVLFYWDNYTQNLNNYNNITFWTSDLISSEDHEFFKQGKKRAGYAFAEVNEWGNLTLGYRPEGKASFTADDYPLKKKFNSGSDLVNERMRTTDISSIGYSAENAEYSSGATMSDGAVYLNKKGEYVTFKDVEFGDKYNAFSIIYRGSKYNGDDSVKVTVGDRMSSKVYTKVNLSHSAADMSYNEVMPVYMIGCEGTKDVTVEANSFESASIAGITLMRVDESLIDEQIIGKTFANNYSEIVKSTSTIQKYTTGTQGISSELAISGGNSGAVIKYEDVELVRDVNNAMIAAGSNGSSAEGTIEIRLNSLDSEPVADIVIPNGDWNIYALSEQKLDKEIKAGTYDVYLTFTGLGKSSNFWWFGFNVVEEGDVE